MDNRRGVFNLVVVIIALIILAGGATFFLGRGPKLSEVPIEEKKMIQEEAMMEEDKMEGGAMNKYLGKVLSGIASPVLDFNKADYEAALKSDKLLVLYFYANWCPICKAETAGAFYPAFNELKSENVLGFRINYNDSDTDNDEKALAREFGIAYQHSKVLVKNGERLLKSPEGWNKARYLSEIAKHSN